ncbi:low temperature requirement protein LtrA [Mesorhizobium soli]|uniref:low temperature requirement protein A n=1 Tax=Pseudaminobacter soli (ex Li et al. 2025) TaxID=1295366 RepID=UPI002476BBF2|nr:low temperature requirement protein A [Mesorhizobium soli]MDH6232799.1 low temperature requirement protein LtrA [Mesorhizobium soli]
MAESKGILGSRRDLARVRTGEEAKVEYVELFFDLVFVFAATQISHSLLRNLTVLGAFHAAFLLMAVWWVWVYTSWVTNWMDPRHSAVRLLLFILMLAGLLLSTSIPEAFDSRGLVFAGAYVFMQVGRSIFMLWALRLHNRVNYLNFCRITAWLSLSGVFWIAGGFAEGETRFAIWIVALLIEYAAPAAGFWTPRLGASKTAEWDVEGGHMAERSALFIIIALGESVVVTGATFAGLELTTGVMVAFLASFGATVAMWWIYFNIGAETAKHHIETSSDPGRIARIAYTYSPLLLVAGIIVTAVGDELTLAHPSGHADMASILTIVGGPALYVFGNLVFKRIAMNITPLSHMIGLALLLVVGLCGPLLNPVTLSVLTTVILFSVAYWEYKLHTRRLAASH